MAGSRFLNRRERSKPRMHGLSRIPQPLSYKRGALPQAPRVRRHPQYEMGEIGRPAASAWRDGRVEQAGVALISVLLIVAILTALVYQLLGRHSLNIAHSQNSLGFDQAFAYALGAEALARQALYQDFSESETGIDTLVEPWATAMPPFEIEDEGFLEIKARDLNRCFNLNALADEEEFEQNLKRFKTLLTMLGIPEVLADTLRDWLDADEAITGFGAEDSQYLLREPAYRSPNARMSHVSELRLLAGFEPEYWDALLEHVCVLPITTLAINVNTATPPLFFAAAANPNLDAIAIQALVEATREFADTDIFLAELPVLMNAADILAVTSSYFEVQVRAQVGDSVAVLTSTLHRNLETGEITLISRDLGKDFHLLFDVAVEDA